MAPLTQARLSWTFVAHAEQGVTIGFGAKVMCRCFVALLLLHNRMLVILIILLWD